MTQCREIKFRAWDRERYRMLGPFGLADISYKSDGGTINLKDWDDLADVEDLEWLQYTGLKDKNGEEIYEGDIVRYYDSTTMWIVAEIIDAGACFAVKTDENPIPLYEFVGSYVYDGRDIEEIDIIGNIYEQPELLGKTPENPDLLAGK